MPVVDFRPAAMRLPSMTCLTAAAQLIIIVIRKRLSVNENFLSGAVKRHISHAIASRHQHPSAR